MTGKLLLFCILLFTINSLFAQYTLNGNASQNDCHCYTLTNNDLNQTGSVWNNNKINLTQSFDFNFDVFLGCADADGADGIAFVLQPISTSVGTTGNGLGYAGVKPSVGVTIDTYQNGSPETPGPDGDPAFDHIAIQLNGDLQHKDSLAPLPVNNIAGPVSALSGSGNIEDCQWHILRIRWEAPTKRFSAYIDGVLRVTAVKDLVTDVFGGDPMVFWGFTGSTGGSKNLQQMCTSLKPLFRFLPDQKRCIRELISFVDSTISFAPLQKRYWDFGDGSPVDSVNINPVHAYAAAGEYTVLQTVLGADGCIEINSQKIIIGSTPTANFTSNNTCVMDSGVNFINTSSATFGTLNSWFWDFGNGDTSTAKQPLKVFTTPGFKTVKLAVKSLEGCVSDTIEQIVQVYDRPVADFSFIDNQCINNAVQFSGVSTINEGSITAWTWTFDTISVVATQKIANTYGTAGFHQVTLVTKSSNGCSSNVVSKLLNIIPSPVAYFTNTPACLKLPVLFTDSSYNADANGITGYWWSFGNGSISTSKNTSTVYTVPGDISVELVVKSRNGCLSDTIKKILSLEFSPLAKFGYSLPLCENSAITFSDSSFINSGTIKSWSWSFDNGSPATTSNTTGIFASGTHQVKLVVQNANGCNSDTAIANLSINPLPVVDFTVADACKSTSVPFSGINKSGSAIVHWQWAFDDGTLSLAQDTLHLFKNGGTFPVKLFCIASTGCYSDTVQKDIIVYATKAFAGNDTIAATNQPIQLQANGGVSYKWYPGIGLSNTDISNPVAINSTDRMYILRAFTPLGCESFDTISIKVYDGPEIYVPAAFTPNGDGLNELLKALPVGMKQFKSFTIYNRLGQVVFSTAIYSRGWDGSFKGKAQPAGAYIWTATAIGAGGNEIMRKGTAILIR